MTEIPFHLTKKITSVSALELMETKRIGQGAK